MKIPIMRSPRTCNHCRAFIDGPDRCLFNYPTETYSGAIWHKANAYEDYWVTIRPIGKCPKPKNLKEMLVVYNYLEEEYGQNHIPYE